MFETLQAFPRLWSKVDADGDCWEWKAYRRRDGYGALRYRGMPRPAHAVVYETLVDRVPDGMELDHLCRNHGCVNPDHLEPVTHAENIRRGVWGAAIPGKRLATKTHCPQGHPYSGDNLYIDHRGSRICLQCKRADGRSRYEKRNAEARAARAARRAEIVSPPDTEAEVAARLRGGA